MKIIDCITGKSGTKKRLQLQIVIYSILMAAGIVFAVLRLSGFIDMEDTRAMSVFDGFSSCYIIVGLVRIVKNTRIIKNEKRLKGYEIAIKDERNIAIQRRALVSAVYVSVWIGLIVGMILLFFNYTAAVTILYSICFLLISYVVFTYIFAKIM